MGFFATTEQGSAVPGEWQGEGDAAGSATGRDMYPLLQLPAGVYM